MIFYFTGTGNSRYIAEGIAHYTNDELVSINEILKNNSTDESFTSDKPYVFVLPVYAWRIPHIIDNFIKSSEFKGSNKVYFVVNCASSPGNTIKYIEETCKYKSFDLQGFYAIMMPANNIVLVSSNDDEEIELLLENADVQIKNIANEINNNEKSEEFPVNIIDILDSAIVNGLYYKFKISANGFKTTDKCNSCGQCIEVCPLNNISLKDKKVVWGSNCTHCLACINSCPNEAIEYKNKTQNKKRYYLTKHFE